MLSLEGADESATLQGGRFPLPFGSVDVIVDQSSLTFAGRTMTSFVPTMNLTVEGFKNNYRSDGLGAPLAAGLAAARRSPTPAWCCRRTCVCRPLRC